MADQRWRSRPIVMSPHIMARTADRIAQHVRSHDLSSVDVVLHGGEPLLAGPKRIAQCVSYLRSAVSAEVDVRLTLQTNGVQLDDDMLRLFREWQMRVSVSFDGDRSAHDRHRRQINGTSSYSRVTEALYKLTKEPNRQLFSGLLCTIDLDNDPVRTYLSLLQYQPPVVDFLLPHGNWSAPPPQRAVDSASTPYADWLIIIFQRWYGAAKKETRVRLFEEIINLIMGGTSTVDGVGLGPLATIMIETDGAIEQSDMLSSTYEGAASTGLHVTQHSFDEALLSPGVVIQQSGTAGLSPTCRSCSVLKVCGGGLYPHRYRDGNGFANPSVYCADLFRLIEHIRTQLARDLNTLMSQFEPSR
jgi:uncharacterized protein